MEPVVRHGNFCGTKRALRASDPAGRYYASDGMLWPRDASDRAGVRKLRRQTDLLQCVRQALGLSARAIRPGHDPEVLSTLRNIYDVPFASNEVRHGVGGGTVDELTETYRVFCECRPVGPG